MTGITAYLDRLVKRQEDAFQLNTLFNVLALPSIIALGCILGYFAVKIQKKCC